MGKVVHTRLGKELIKEKRDAYREVSEPTEYLLGENLGERNKQLLKSVIASNKCMNTNLAYRGKCRHNFDHQRGAGGSYTKYRRSGRSRGRGM